TINPDGTVTYTPAADYQGADLLTYAIRDGEGGTATATVRLSVTPVDDAPVAVNDAAATPCPSPVSARRRTAAQRSARTARSPTRRPRTTAASTLSPTRSLTDTSS